ncbi:hypothetical protein [Mycolicibacterium bacteremicum]|uniref:Uncharacterized protein n=1 Tax=Mycolicibacterium bacteremicum TaxID=564198 RepID=A0A1W9YQ04_MYCBA|nr:hypothetical protein [Mycolicibacterium bacteremicum]MCV7434854.1 hypothetical protein [Mycolicibacterium bacteremicum]ORA02151.1 hypothetical protein BST17_24895 [Mycolicibacterium bacteremicum]
MSARQVARDLRYVAADLCWAVVKVSVDGLASGVSWWMARRQPAPLPSGAEALTKAEALDEVWEPGCARLLRNPETLQRLLQADETQAVELDLTPEQRDAAAECGVDICCEHWTAFKAGEKCWECEPGPGVVTTPTPGQPTFADHVKALLEEHIVVNEMFGIGVLCTGCDWRGVHSDRNTHLSELIGELVAAETRIAQKLRAAGDK